MAFVNRTIPLTVASQTVYTVPAGKESVVHAIYVTLADNIASSKIKIKAGAVGLTGYIGNNVPLVEGGTLYYPKPVNLAAGEVLDASSEVDNDSEIFISILEQDLPAP